MSELVMGFVPHVAISPAHGIGTADQAILVTDARMILLPWKDCRDFLGPLLDAGASRTKGDASAQSPVNPERWVQPARSVTVPHSALLRLRCRRTINAYWLSIEFATFDGPRKMSGFVVPSRAYLRKRKQEGVSAPRAAFEYAVAVGNVFSAVGPVARVLEWRI